METTGNLKRRVDSLERIAGADPSLLCAGCGLEHVDVAFGLDRLQDRYSGQGAAPVAVCGCPCCVEALRDLTGRYERAKAREAA